MASSLSTTYWTDMFVRHFLFENEFEKDSGGDSDDLLFFIRKNLVRPTQPLPFRLIVVMVFK